MTDIINFNDILPLQPQPVDAGSCGLLNGCGATILLPCADSAINRRAGTSSRSQVSVMNADKDKCEIPSRVLPSA